MHRILNAINSEQYYRRSHPKDIQKLWKVLESVDYQRSRFRFIKKVFFDNMNEFESEKQLKEIINNALNDKLVVEESDLKKGYKLRPSIDRRQLLSQSINDWYCFECHSCDPNEDLIGCKSCFRSFHEKCLQSDIDSSGQTLIDEEYQPNIDSEEQSLNASKNDETNAESEEQLNNETENQSNEEPNSFEEFTAFPSKTPYLDFECQYCQRYKYPDNKCRSKQICGEELTKLIELFYQTIEDELLYKEIDINTELSIEPTLSSFSLLFCPLDLKIIKLKVFVLKNYTSFVEFENDLKHFIHNFCVVKDKQLIQPFIDAIDNELRLMNRCFDCYLWIRAPVEERVPLSEWFLRVCDPPHRLVYAKCGAHPYWPSKVIEWEGDSENCEVQFFEPDLFPTATVPKTKIKEIEYKLESKQLQKEFFIKSIAFLFRYLKNFREQDSNLIYEEVYRRLERVLTRKWSQFHYSFLADLNLEIKINKSKKTIKKRKLEEIQESNDFNQFQTFNDVSRGSICDSQLSDTIEGSPDLYESYESIDSPTTPLDQILSDPQLKVEDKYKICSLIIKIYGENGNEIMSNAFNDKLVIEESDVKDFDNCHSFNDESRGSVCVSQSSACIEINSDLSDELSNDSFGQNCVQPSDQMIDEDNHMMCSQSRNFCDENGIKE